MFHNNLENLSKQELIKAIVEKARELAMMPVDREFLAGLSKSTLQSIFDDLEIGEG